MYLLQPKPEYVRDGKTVKLCWFSYNKSEPWGCGVRTTMETDDRHYTLRIRSKGNDDDACWEIVTPLIDAYKKFPALARQRIDKAWKRGWEVYYRISPPQIAAIKSFEWWITS